MIFDTIIERLLSGSFVTEYGKYISITQHEYEPFTLLNYNKTCTYKHHWDEITRVCRGLIVNIETNEVVALPFPKFFNIGELPETELKQLPSEKFTVFEKLDGSLGVYYKDSNGQSCLSTKGSFKSDQALHGMSLLQQLPNINKIPNNFTLLFEIIYPDNRIVVDYGDKDELILLGIIDRITGKEIHWTKVIELAQQLSVAIPQVYSFTSINELIEIKKDIPITQEGFVIRFENGLRVKLKGDKYFQIARIVSGINRKEILATLVDGTFDKFLLNIPEEFHHLVESLVIELQTKALEYEKKAMMHFVNIPVYKNRKEFALWVQNNVPCNFKSVMFSLLDGYTPNWIKIANHIKQDCKLLS